MDYKFQLFFRKSEKLCLNQKGSCRSSTKLSDGIHAVDVEFCGQAGEVKSSHNVEPKAGGFRVNVETVRSSPRKKGLHARMLVLRGTVSKNAVPYECYQSQQVHVCTLAPKERSPQIFVQLLRKLVTEGLVLVCTCSIISLFLPFSMFRAKY